MPAKSKAQQRFMGMVHGLQKGTINPSDVSNAVKKVAKTMKKKSVKDYASTKHTGKPEKVKTEERDYKDEYKKFQSSPKSKKYRAELNQYNRKKGTYGNNDGKDASHKGGKIMGFEAESKNRGRAEKSRLKKEGKEYKPEKRRKLKTGEVEIMKGKGNRQKWFYLKNQNDVKQLIRLGRNSAFPTGITKNNSKLKFNKSLDIKESVNEGFSSSIVKKAVDIAKKMSGDMTGAVKKIEKIKKGLSDDSKVKATLRTANESVNEAVEPKGNMAKVANIVRNSQAAKLGGVMIDMQSANLLMKVYDKVSDKDKEKMNTLNPKVLTRVIEKLWSRVNLRLPI